VLDGNGRFWHDGGLVEPEALRNALHRWIAVHPDDGRFILTNGYDWTYFTVERTPYFVKTVTGTLAPELMLSDDTCELLDPRAMSVDDDGALIAKVKGGRFEARFTQSAQRELGAWIAPDEPLRILIGEEAFPL